MVCSCSLHHVGYQLGGDGGAQGGLLVTLGIILFSITRGGFSRHLGVRKVGSDHCDGLCRGKLAGVDQEEQLHDGIVRVHSSWLEIIQVLIQDLVCLITIAIIHDNCAHYQLLWRMVMLSIVHDNEL